MPSIRARLAKIEAAMSLPASAKAAWVYFGSTKTDIRVFSSGVVHVHIEDRGPFPPGWSYPMRRGQAVEETIGDDAGHAAGTRTVAPPATVDAVLDTLLAELPPRLARVVEGAGVVVVVGARSEEDSGPGENGGSCGNGGQMLH